MTHILIEVSTACGRRNRLRTVGAFLIVRSFTARSYLGEVGGLPTSNALMYLFDVLTDYSFARRTSLRLPHGITKGELFLIF